MDEMEEPLTDEEIAAMGYDVNGKGWNPRGEQRATDTRGDDEPVPSDESAQDVQEPDAEPFLIRASEVRMENATFVWEPYVPGGVVTVLAGVGGLGKSHATIELAARVTRGQSKGDHRDKPGRVIIATAEDAWAQTVVPRLIAAGADLDRVSFVNIELGFSIPDDLPLLEEAITAEPDMVLVILDPLIAFIPIRLDAHKDQHARGALTPLASLAQRHDLAIMAVMHLNKSNEANALFQRVSSSVGFLNAARSALLIAEDPDDENGRIVAHGKSNLSEPGESLRFRIEGQSLEGDDGTPVKTSRIVWLGASTHGVADLLKSDHRADPRNAAEQWLLDLLTNGPVPTADIKAGAEEAGHAWSTVKRAKRGLDVKARKGGFGGGWEWFLPPEEGHDEGQPAIGEDVVPLGLFGADDPEEDHVNAKKTTSSPRGGPLAGGTLPGPDPEHAASALGDDVCAAILDFGDAFVAANGTHPGAVHVLAHLKETRGEEHDLEAIVAYMRQVGWLDATEG